MALDRYYFALLVATIIVTIAFGAIYGYQMDSIVRTGPVPSAVLADWNGETTVTLKKQLSSQWNWKYADDNREVVQICPSWRHDAAYYANEQLVGTSDGKIASFRQTSYLADHTGEPQYIYEAGDVWEAIINGIRISISMMIRNATTDSVVAYVAGSTFVNDNFWIVNANGTQMVQMVRNKITLSEWEWVFTQTEDNQLPLYVPALIAGHHSFSDGDNTDGCNMLNMAAFYLAIIGGACSFAVIVFGVYQALRGSHGRNPLRQALSN